MKGVVYILEASNGRFYIGSTTDLDRRLQQHASGHTPTTRRMTGLKLVFQQEFPDISLARKIELRLKRFHRHDILQKIITDGGIREVGLLGG
ncbi:MAG: GIY-YIG nuclease family protein [Candidatus Yanofskybacteria bacterium]|nr:GIY-YIG nuclease family protein [Candidatus Yanofskybacteria bacterium]